jgi:hypothetical protein
MKIAASIAYSGEKGVKEFMETIEGDPTCATLMNWGRPFVALRC